MAELRAVVSRFGLRRAIGGRLCTVEQGEGVLDGLNQGWSSGSEEERSGYLEGNTNDYPDDDVDVYIIAYCAQTTLVLRTI